MKIVHLSTHDVWGGAAIAAHRLHATLRKMGQESTMFVEQSRGDGQGVVTFIPPRDLGCRIARSFRRRALARDLSHYSKSGLDDGELFSDDRSPYASSPLGQIPSCDVLHLHWVTEFIDCGSLFEWLPKNKPVVWTMHDMNAFTGGCHFDSGCGKHRSGCGNCPKLSSGNEDDLSRQIWKRRQSAYSSMAPDQLQVVAPCTWVADEVKQGGLLGHFPVSVIPNGVDIDELAPRDRGFAREALGLPAKAKVLLFAAHSVGERRKGFSFLVEAISGMRDVEDLYLLSVGKYAELHQLGIPYRSLGYISNQRLLSIVYSAADLFVVPTLQETGPMTAVESLACGTPVIGFPAGNMPDFVHPGITGMLVPSSSSEQLREGMRNLLANPEALADMRPKCRQVAVEQFSLDILTRRYVALYESMLARN